MKKNNINTSILVVWMLNILLFWLLKQQDNIEDNGPNEIKTGNKKNLSLNKIDENQCKINNSLKQNKEIIFVWCNDFY